MLQWRAGSRAAEAADPGAGLCQPFILLSWSRIAQWLLMPRIEAKVVPAALAWSRQGIIDDDVIAELGRTADGSRTTLETRLGDWWPWVRWEVADLSGRAAGGRVAPRLLLGGRTLSGWRLLWDPGVSQLGLVPEEAELAGLQ